MSQVGKRIVDCSTRPTVPRPSLPRSAQAAHKISLVHAPTHVRIKRKISVRTKPARPGVGSGLDQLKIDSLGRPVGRVRGDLRFIYHSTIKRKSCLASSQERKKTYVLFLVFLAFLCELGRNDFLYNLIPISHNPTRRRTVTKNLRQAATAGMIPAPENNAALQLPSPHSSYRKLPADAVLAAWRRIQVK